MSQRPTIPGTNSGTSETSSKKKEHWKTKQKREREEAAKLPPKGNPDFLLTKEMEAQAMADFESLAEEAHFSNIEESVPRGTAIAAITAEDREIDLLLERAAKTNPIQDLGPEIVLKPEHKTRDILRNYVKDYRPASTLMELEEQVGLAKQNEIDSIEATPALVRHIFKSSFDHIQKTVGYGIYKDIRVYIDGFFNDHKDADSLTMERKLHGGSKIDTVPIITPQKV